MTYIHTPVWLYALSCAACGERFEDDGFTWLGELEWVCDCAEGNGWRRLGDDGKIWLCPKHADNPPKQLQHHAPYCDVVDSVTLQCDEPGCTRVFEPEYVEDDECSVGDEANWYGWVADSEHGRHWCPEHGKDKMSIEQTMSEAHHTIHESVTHYGEDIQGVVCMEECAELIQAVSKAKRYGNTPERHKALVEEMADVAICLDMLADMYGVADDELAGMITAKTRRNAERMHRDGRES